MNVESYGYSLITTALGMLVVFLSLTALSLLMVLLKSVFAGRKTRAAATAGAPPGPARPTAPPLEEGRQAPPWLTAAVAAYLAAEEPAEERPSTEAWYPEVNHYDPWLAAGRSGVGRWQPPAGRERGA